MDFVYNAVGGYAEQAPNHPHRQHRLLKYINAQSAKVADNWAKPMTIKPARV